MVVSAVVVAAAVAVSVSMVDFFWGDMFMMTDYEVWSFITAAF